MQIEQGIELFLESLKSEQSRIKYKFYLNRYMKLTGIKDLLHESDPRLIESEIVDFIIKMKKQGMTFTALKNYTTAVFSFYKINDIMIRTSKISKFMPENKRVKKDRGYTREEISKMLEIADERSRVVILLLASTGIRVGLIPDLQIRHLQDNKITRYENTKDEFFTFITPECKKAIDSYIDFRSRYGEKITDDSPLIREQFDIRNPFGINNAKSIGKAAFQWIIRDLATRCNVISKEVPITHGFRKFLTTQMVKSHVNPEIREMSLGHKIGLASAYYRPTEEEMYQEYEKAIDNLTIDPANRLQKEVELLEGEKNEITTLKNQVNEMKATMKDFTDLMKLRLENEGEADYKEDLKKNNEMISIDKRLSEKGIKEHKYLANRKTLIGGPFLSKAKRERMNEEAKQKTKKKK